MDAIYTHVEKFISIPFGAIKRLFAKLCDVKVSISIPFGAIKSNTLAAHVNENIQISIPFGAIKRLGQKNSPLPLCISIPFGAIKSFAQFVLQHRPSLFQFLLVRLRVSEVEKLFVMEVHFNSFWCD